LWNFPNYILLKNPKFFGYRSAQWSCVRLSAGVKPHAHGYNQGGWPCRKREVMLRFVSFFLRNLLEAIANSFSTVLFYYRVFWAIYFCWRNQLSVLRYSRLYRYSIMQKLWRMRFQYFIRKTILCYYIDIILQLWSTAKFRIYICYISAVLYGIFRNIGFKSLLFSKWTTISSMFITRNVYLRSLNIVGALSIIFKWISANNKYRSNSSTNVKSSIIVRETADYTSISVTIFRKLKYFWSEIWVDIWYYYQTFRRYLRYNIQYMLAVIYGGHQWRYQTTAPASWRRSKAKLLWWATFIQLSNFVICSYYYGWNTNVYVYIRM